MYDAENDEFVPHYLAVSDLLLFRKHFGNIPSPFAERLYGCLLELCEKEAETNHHLCAKQMGRIAGITPLRAYQAMEELERYGALEIWERDKYREYGPFSLGINPIQDWRSADLFRGRKLICSAHIYVIKHRNSYKIGRSGQLFKRVRVIGRKLVGPWSLYHVMRADHPRRVEAFWHRQFKHLEIKRKGTREWFRLGDPELRWLKRVGGVRVGKHGNARDLELQALCYARRFRPEAAVTRILSAEEEEHYEMFSEEIWG